MNSSTLKNLHRYAENCKKSSESFRVDAVFEGNVNAFDQVVNTLEMFLLVDSY